MKKLIFSTVLLLIAILGSVSICSCSSSDDNSDGPSTPTNKRSKYQVIYNVQLSEAYYQFFDIEMTYTTSKGEEATETITKNKKYELTVDYNSKPSKLACKIMAKPKSTNVPDIVETQTYNMDKSCSAQGIIYFQDGSIDKSYSLYEPSSSTLPVSGTKMSAFIQKEHLIFSNSIDTPTDK